jgi:hypothetical protein
VTTTQRNLIHDLYIMRRLPALARDAGLRLRRTRAHAYVQTETPDYLLSLVARGTDAAATAGDIGPALAEGFRSEATRRAAEGTFYGAILFVILVAEKPGGA